MASPPANIPPLVSEKEQKRREERKLALAEFKYIREWRKEQGLGPVPDPPAPASPSQQPGSLVPPPLQPGQIPTKESSPRKLARKMKSLLLSPSKKGAPEYKEGRYEDTRRERKSDRAESTEESTMARPQVAGAQTSMGLTQVRIAEERGSEEDLTALPLLPASPEQMDANRK